MAYDTTEAVAKFLSGFQMKITNRERDTVAPDYYVKYSLTLSKGGKDFSTTFVSDGEPTVTQVFSALADDALTLRKYSTDEFVDKLYAQGVKPSAMPFSRGFPTTRSGWKKPSAKKPRPSSLTGTPFRRFWQERRNEHGRRFR